MKLGQVSLQVENILTELSPKFHVLTVCYSQDKKSPCLKFGSPLCPGVGQQRLMPHGLYAQEKACKQEERLLERLQSIDLDPTLLRVLQRQVTLLLEGEWLL